jgi:hypothetical protein
MKKLIFLFFILLILSCNNNSSKFTDNEWIERVYFNENKTDSLILNDRIKFFKNGEIIKNKYFLCDYKYKVTNNKFNIIRSDSICKTYKIIKCTENEIILENRSIIKIDGKDTLFYILYVLDKTTPLLDKPYDNILYNLCKLYDIGIADTLGDGSIFYNFDASKYESGIGFIYDNPFKIEPKIKGVIDKTLKMLPKKENINEYDKWFSCYYRSYEWETLDFILTMKNSFKTSYNDEQYLDIKIWIVEK